MPWGRFNPEKHIYTIITKPYSSTCTYHSYYYEAEQVLILQAEHTSICIILLIDMKYRKIPTYTKYGRHTSETT